ncbi:MAG: sulfurtransferase TusA family protein [Candidatus Melainabacteria bacterium]|jgi:TusA-related sulfurtransferase|nr:sulfurtransferase TusA family protein [Candidatus Melainabacteria bacterium]
MTQTLDLKNTPCPINFVRTKLKLDDMQAGDQLTVALDDGEAISSVEMSIQQEGHNIKSKIQQNDGSWLLEIIKTAS